MAPLGLVLMVLLIGSCSAETTVSKNLCAHVGHVWVHAFMESSRYDTQPRGDAVGKSVLGLAVELGKSVSVLPRG
jgi:hypothetical protein